MLEQENNMPFFSPAFCGFPRALPLLSFPPPSRESTSSLGKLICKHKPNCSHWWLKSTRMVPSVQPWSSACFSLDVSPSAQSQYGPPELLICLLSSPCCCFFQSPWWTSLACLVLGPWTCQPAQTGTFSTSVSHIKVFCKSWYIKLQSYDLILPYS